MTGIGRRLLFWAPRVLAIAYALFLGVFALDIFGQGYSFWQTVLGLSIHLIPSGLVALALAISWRWEWTGPILFGGLGLLYLLRFANLQWPVYLGIVGPLFLVGALFLANWLHRRPAN